MILRKDFDHFANRISSTIAKVFLFFEPRGYGFTLQQFNKVTVNDFDFIRPFLTEVCYMAILL